MMDHHIAIVGIFVRDLDQSEGVNALLHEYGSYIVGRLGVPCRGQDLSVISIIMDAPNDIVNALCGKLGRIRNVQAKTMHCTDRKGI